MTERWWVELARPAEVRVELLCLPHAGGRAEVFAPWSAVLPPHVALTAVELPGRGTRLAEAPVAEREALLDRLCPALEQRMRGHPAPTVLLGHSMGAVLAFEICRRLAGAEGARPALLVVAAHRPPHQPLRGPALHAADDRALLDDLRRIGATPAEVLDDADIMPLLLPMIRADYALAETWAPGREAAVDVPLLAVGGWGDDELPPAGVQGWRAHTRAAFEWRMFEGGHFFLHHRPAALWAVIRMCLQRMHGAAADGGTRIARW